MKANKAYVISYISDKWDENTRLKRERAHSRQVAWLKSKGFDVYIFAQYQGKHEGVTYLPYDGKRYLPGDARNQCLKHFYQTDDDYCFLLDDDIILFEDKVCSGNIIDILQGADHLIEYKIGIMMPILPAYDPYSEFLEKYGETIKSNFVLKNRPHMSSQFMIVKNFKKFYNQEIFFRENWCEADCSVKFGEDAIFSLDITKLGYGSYKLWNWSVYDLGATISTHSNGVQTREQITNRFRAIAKELAEMYNIEIKPGGKSGQMVQWSKFGLKHGNARELVIPFKQENESWFT